MSVYCVGACGRDTWHCVGAACVTRVHLMRRQHFSALKLAQAIHPAPLAVQAVKATQLKQLTELSKERRGGQSLRRRSGGQSIYGARGACDTWQWSRGDRQLLYLSELAVQRVVTLPGRRGRR